MLETKRACTHVYPSGRSAERDLYEDNMPAEEAYELVHYCQLCGRLRYESGRKLYPTMFVRPYKKRGRRLGSKRAKR